MLNKTPFRDVGERIKVVRKKLGKSQEEFADMLGYKTKAGISQLESGIIDVSQSKLKAIAQYGNVDIGWLLYGQSSITYNVKVPLLGEIGAGSGVEITYELNQATEFIDWVINPDEHFFLKINRDNGMSMMPLVNEGDMVLCHLTQKCKEYDLVVAIKEVDGSFTGILKLYQTIPENNTIALTSYNTVFAPIFISKTDQRYKFYKVIAIKRS